VTTGFVPLRVAAVDRLTDDSVAVRFDQPASGPWRFRAGQHLTLRRVLDGTEQRRTYSLCTSSTSGTLRVAVKRLDGGVFSTWATRDLRPGDEVEAMPPAGSFGPALDPARTRRYGLLAAGSGITPVLSIAASALDVEPASEVLLVLGNRTQRSVMLLDDLADLKDRHRERLQVLHVLSQEPQSSDLLSGRLDGERLQRLRDAGLLEGVDEWYVCGPAGMVQQAQRTLTGPVHVELFHAGPPPPRPPRTGPPAAAATLTVLLHGRTSTVSADREAPVLDAVLAARPDAPYACRGGVCGTCRARVVEGAVEMDRNWALEPDELAAGVVLTCQARPTTDRVSLEFL
jgi:ring-1,2-phenylacetyl-CoA epoxidase subunit PaaE